MNRACTLVLLASLSAASPARASISPARIDAIVERTASEVSKNYVDATLAEAMARDLRHHRRSYRRIPTIDSLCVALTADLQHVSHDLHLRLVYSPESLAVDAPGSQDDSSYMESVRAEGRTRNFGFDQVSRLAGNIGYVRISTFFPAEHGRAVADAAMEFLANTDAVIVDLRSNTGGSPSMVGHLLGYFFADSTVIGTEYDRVTGRTTTNVVVPTAGAVAFRNKPVFVLLDGSVFSAGEAFAYALQSFGRGVIVGEKTRGGAHLTTGWTIDPHVTLRIPHARGINARTGTDWEGTGVVPDIAVAAAKASVAAQIAALRALGQRPGNGALAEERTQALARLEEAMNR